MTTQQPETTPSCEAFASQLQVFASAWAIVGGQFDAGDGMQTADAERAIVLDMWRRLHTENEALRAGYDAARQEIASLRAQLATVSVGGVGSLVSVPPECPHLIWYADQDRKPEMFVGHGARDTAMKRFHMISQHWNANLFVRIKKSSRDCPYPVADLAPAPAQAQHEGGKSEALADLAYAHGMTTGWNLCIADKHDEFARIRSMRSSQAISTIEAPQPAAQAQDDQWKTPTTVLQRAGDTLQLLCAGQRPPDVIITDWLDNSSEELQAWCCQYGPSWCQGIAVIDAAMLMVDQPTEIVTPESNADHEHRTSPQPAAQAQEDAGGWMRDGALLYRLTDECRPTNFDEIRVTMANGSRDIDQTSARAERLLVMLAAQAQPVTVPWENFPSYLIDHCEGDTISEEGLQFALSKMLSDPQYAPQPAAKAAPVEAQHSTACLYHYALSRLGLRDNTGLRVLFWDAHNSLSWDSKTDWYVTPDADKADCGQCNAARAAQGGNHD